MCKDFTLSLVTKELAVEAHVPSSHTSFSITEFLAKNMTAVSHSPYLLDLAYCNSSVSPLEDAANLTHLR
jgi:hypothetical protein